MLAFFSSRISMSEARIDLVQYVSVVRRWWRTAFSLVLIVVLFTGLFTLLADDRYVAHATLLPQGDPGQGTSASGMPVSGGYCNPFGSDPMRCTKSNQHRR